jgi:hydroxyacylglutathione hydrolase
MSLLFERRRYAADNYLYLAGEGGDAVLVDPGDPFAALGLCHALGIRPRAVLHTHGHADHSGGSDEMKEALGVPVLGHAADARWYAPDVDLAGRGEVELGSLRLRLHHAPGHTPGSILVEWRGRLLTGDTLFWGGSGNCRHGGDPAVLAETFLGTLASLDGGLLVNPGHDYGEANLPFALDLEPGNAAARERLEAVRAAHAAGREPEPSTLALERATNPFLRVAALRPELERRGLPCASDAEAFVSLRRLRDGWR